MSELPTGRVTFLFTDIEGSTRLVQQLGPDVYAQLLGRHSDLLRTAVAAHSGVEFGSEGDAHFFAFADPGEAVRAAVVAQLALRAASWPSGGEVRARMGVHTGAPELHGENYVGVDLNRVARVTAAGHGGQILATEASTSQLSSADAGVRFVDLGRHRLKDLVEPEHIYQVVAADLLAEFPPIRTIDTRPKVLPAQVASFFGRAAELAEVQRLLREHRLVTLTGPGGSGKTRLAIAAAERLLPQFEDGVFFVELASLRDEAMVDLTAAGVLGLRESPERPIREALTEYLKPRQLLLAFDNFEHLLAAAGLVGELLSAASGLRVMVTSRILLHVYGEREFALPPLPAPPEGATLGQLEDNAAVALFVDRAAAVSPGFELTSQNADTIASICRRLDGLPLAIELAAARIRILSPAELATRLERGLGSLGGGATDLPERQRTLRATIAWSYELLDHAQRSLLARLSAFDAGWTLEAAESVASEGLGGEVADVLESIVDHSLVTRRQTAVGGRFSMLETIREFAAEALAEAGETEEIAARHAAFFVDLAERAEPNLTGDAAADWARRLGDDVDNLRAAFRWSLAVDDPDRLELGLRLAAAIWRYWQMGSLSEGREWLDQLLARSADAPPSRARVRALIAAGGIAYWQQDYESTTDRYLSAGAMAELVGEPRLQAEAIENVAYVPFFKGDFPRARELMAQARNLWLEVGDDFRAALAESLRAYTLLYEGRPAEALPAQERLVEEARRKGERYWLINGITGVGQVHRAMGTIYEARRAYAEALSLALEDGNLAMLTMVLEPMSNVERDAGEHERAVRLWAASDAIRLRMGGGAPADFMMVADPREAAAAVIGQEAVDRAWSEGQAMSPSDAVSEAMAIAGLKQS